MGRSDVYCADAIRHTPCSRRHTSVAASVTDADAVPLRIAVVRRQAPDARVELGIGLEAAGIAYDDKGVTVDAGMRTSNPDVFAAGDVADDGVVEHLFQVLSPLAPTSPTARGALASLASKAAIADEAVVSVRSETVVAAAVSLSIVL